MVVCWAVSWAVALAAGTVASKAAKLAVLKAAWKAAERAGSLVDPLAAQKVGLWAESLAASMEDSMVARRAV